MVGKSHQLVGAADGDSGAKQANPAGTTGAPPNQKTVTSSATKKPTTNPNVSAPNGPSTPPNASAGAATNANSTGPSAPVDEPESTLVNSRPGRRLNNPLGEFSSYTYQISLYMITPDAYDLFVSSGRTKIDLFNSVTAGEQDAGGAFLIAQSGGINNSNSKRAPGFENDYYIDNLSFHSQLASAESVVTEMSFKIIEPYGFSFISNLKKASDQVIEYSKGTGMLVKNGGTGPENPSKQFFILGIRFLGYDASGNPISSNSEFNSDRLDPTAANSALFESFYDIMISSIEFKIDGRATTYTCTAASLPPAQAFNVKKGMTPVDYTVTANTVGEAINKVMDELNKTQNDWKAKNTISIPTKYSIDWSAPGASAIKNASIISDADLDKYKWAGSGAKTTEKVAVDKETKSQPKENFRKLSFGHATPILDVINQIVKHSKYLEDALTVVNTTALESDPIAKNPPVQEPKTNKMISWYNCSPIISNAKWDPIIADWAYDITYKIQKYETPVINTPYANPGINYYGPHKKYSYWYTGKNSEVLSYEQVLNNAYFNIVVAPADDTGTTATSTKPAADKSGNESSRVSKTPGVASNQPRLGRTGYGDTSQNTYLTSLYDPAGFVEATIKIAGDPDFLIQSTVSSEKAVYDKFYGSDGFSINPNGGQVFIEIDFKEAVDYGTDGDLDNNTGGGVLKINDSIQFWKYEDEIDKMIDGISYRVREVVSTFSNGSFTQVIIANINTFAEPTGLSGGNAARPAEDKSNTTGGAAPTNNAAGKGSTGTPQSKPFDTSKPKLPAANTSNKSPSQPTSKTGPAAKPVADDDGGKG